MAFSASAFCTRAIAELSFEAREDTPGLFDGPLWAAVERALNAEFIALFALANCDGVAALERMVGARMGEEKISTMQTRKRMLA